MYFVKILYCFLFNFRYIRSPKVPFAPDDCLIPFSTQPCSPLAHIDFPKTHLVCQVDSIRLIRNFKCSYSMSKILSSAQSFILLYPPFIEVFLNHTEMHHLKYLFRFLPNVNYIDIDLRPLINLNPLINIHMLIRLLENRANILYRTYTRSFMNISYVTMTDGKWVNITLPSSISITNRTSLKSTDETCYLIGYHQRNSSLNITQQHLPCSFDQCRMLTNEIQLCLESNPCLVVGDAHFLCRINRLQPDDRFIHSNSTESLLYTELTIVTTNISEHTLHTFSENLLKACITKRLVIITIHGKLKIPVFNFTSVNCSPNVTIEVEFWHGDCSTFGIFHNKNLEEMYQARLFKLGNFYTGYEDRININCAIITPSIPIVIENKKRVFDLITACLLGLMICLMCFITICYRKSSDY